MVVVAQAARAKQRTPMVPSTRVTVVLAGRRLFRVPLLRTLEVAAGELTLERVVFQMETQVRADLVEGEPVGPRQCPPRTLTVRDSTV